MAPTKPPGTVGRYSAGVTSSGGVCPVDKAATTCQAIVPWNAKASIATGNATPVSSG